MSNYDFSALNDKEFEELTRDLFSRALGKKFKSFKRGKDNGIDIRFSTNSKLNSIVIQAKHYSESGYKALYRNLIKEKAKVARIDPSRYIIVTSVKILPQHQAAIYKLFKPHMESASDVYGNESINQMLSDYPDLESKYFKLWISSTNVLLRVLHNAVKGRSEFHSEKIKQNIRKYVQNPSLLTGIKILEKHRYLMITGEPGVGKTTLANIIIYSFLAKEYELIYIDREIKDAEDFNLDPKQKQIFYFDDFLGANYHEILHPKTSDSGMVNFIERIQRSENKYLILTTRTTVLNTARENFEKLKRANLDLARKELELREYTPFDKAKILYNHMYFGNLTTDLLNEIYTDKNYRKIIQHRNFNPRLIDNIIDRDKFNASGESNYFSFITHTLENPEHIWRHSFQNQINEEDRFLLLTLFSFGNHAEENNLQKAFNKKLEYEIKNNGFARPTNTYNNCLRRLLDGHLRRTKDWVDNIFISFINPSLSDFFIHYLKISVEERKKMIASCFYLEQVERIVESFHYSVLRNKSNYEEAEEFLDWFMASSLQTSTVVSDKDLFIQCKKMQILTRFVGVKYLATKADRLIATILDAIDPHRINSYEYYAAIIPVMDQRKEGGQTEKIFSQKWMSFINSLWSSVSEESEIDQIRSLFESYNKNYSHYLLITSNRTLVQNRIRQIATEKINDEIMYSRDEIVDKAGLENLENELLDIWQTHYSEAGLPVPKPSFEEQLKDFDRMLFRKNKIRKDLKKDDLIKPKLKPNTVYNEKSIDALFDRHD